MTMDREAHLRIAALEAKVNHMYRHLTGQENSPAVVPPLPDPSANLSPQVAQLIDDGNIIGAIKQYRAETGADLAEAKRVVEGS